MKQTINHEQTHTLQAAKGLFSLGAPFIYHKRGLAIRWKVASGGSLEFPGSESVVVFECS